jgi:tetratricopeptide (TPR) repeat protein
VLERLPLREGPAWAAIRELQARLAAEPGEAQTAAALAREYLTLVRQTGEPRLLAYAHRALARWNDEPEPPANIALQRALLAQSEHHFAEARAELVRLVAREPGETEAWLALAAIDTVQGRYAEANTACMRLVLAADPAVTAGCVAATKAMTREAGAAYTLLAGHVRRRERMPRA